MCGWGRLNVKRNGGKEDSELPPEPQRARSAHRSVLGLPGYLPFPFHLLPSSSRPRVASPQQGAARPLMVSARVTRHTHRGFFLSPLRPGFIRLRRAAGSVTYQVLCGLGKKPNPKVDSRVQLV